MVDEKISLDELRNPNYSNFEIFRKYLELKTELAKEKLAKIQDESMGFGNFKSIINEISHNDYLPASALLSAAILTGPEDLRDAVSAYKQIKKGFPKPVTLHSGYDNKIAQHPFSFLRGTILHEYLNPFSPECLSQDLAKKALKHDKSLWETKFGEWVQKKLGINIKHISTNIKKIDYTETNKRYVSARVIKTNNPIKDIIARAMLRTPKLGLYFYSGVEAAHVLHETIEGKNFFVEMGKSAATLGATTIATGVFGAIGAKKLGPTGSLLGITLGSITGTIVNKKLNDNSSGY